ncbi:hypothetical protein [Maricaulis sp.]|nr:hypothetical protein [Maricaulis sp.]MBO6796046.1 hypothetical protein [Maricaulis sp.]
MAYDWKYDTNAPEDAQIYYGRAGWLTRLFNAAEGFFRFLGKSGDYNRKV